MAINIPINTFNAGELSPYLYGRQDLDKYSSGCKTMLNMRPLKYGGAQKRRGFEFIGEAKYSDRPCRLVKFQFSTLDYYMLEMGDNYIRFYKNGEPILDAAGDPLEVATVYGADDVFALQWVQSNDVIYFSHKDYPPQKLSRYGDTDWTFEAVEFDQPAFCDLNIDTENTFTYTGETEKGSTGALASSKDIFTQEHVGAYFALEHPRTDMLTTGSGNGTTIIPNVRGKWALSTGGTWDGTITLYRSYDKGNSWEPYRVYAAASDRNLDVSGDEDERCYIKVDVQMDGNVGWDFVLDEVYFRSIVRVDAVSGAKAATVTAITDIYSTEATTHWYEGAWSQRRGYPAACAFFQQRLFFGGTRMDPQTIWGSQIDDYENFEFGSLDTDGLSYTFASDEQNAIVWMCAINEILVGTTGGEWSVGSTDYREALTPSNVRVNRQSTYGSGEIGAQMVNDSILFAQRGNRRLRQMHYSIQKDGYDAPDLTVLAEHIAGEGIVDTAYQQHPESVIWCVRKDGVLAALTYEAEQNVAAWSRHETQGEFISIEAVAGKVGDELWAAVRRVRPDGEHIFIERAQSENTFENTYSFVDKTQTIKEEPSKVQVAFVVNWEQLQSYTGGNKADGPMCTSNDTMGSASDSYRELVKYYEEQWPGKCEFALLLYTSGQAASGNNIWQAVDFSSGVDFLNALETKATVDTSGQKQYRAMDALQYIRRLSWQYSPDVLRMTLLVTGYGYGSQETYTADQLAQGDFALSSVNSLFCYLYNYDTNTPIVSTPFDEMAHVSSQYNSSVGTKEAGVQGLTQEITKRIESGGFAVIANEVDFLDCSKTFRGEALREIDGLEHLEGLQVSVVADGVYAGKFTVENGKIDLGFTATDVRAGLEYSAELETLSIDANTQQGTTQGLKRQIKGVALRLYRAGEFLAGESSQHLVPVIFRDTTDDMDSALALFSGIRMVHFDSATERECGILVKSEKPYPLTVLSAVAQYI